MNRGFQDANRASLDALRTEIEGLDDDQLSLPTVAGWTISATLAHMAFYDFRTLHLLKHWRENGIAPSPFDVDAINEALKPICLGLPPRVAAGLVLQAAEQIDQEIENTPDELVEKIRSAGVEFNFDRHEHREYHLKEFRRMIDQPK